MNSPLLIRADAGGALGSGHVMRMIALAQAVQDRGGSVTLACVSCPEGIAARVRREGIACECIEASALGSATDREQTIARAKTLGAAWVVVDGYHFDTEYQQALRAAGLRVLAVDDYGHCETWAAEAVLNQNLFAPELSYRSEVDGCRFLLGTKFVLLRREFREEAERRPPARPEVTSADAGSETGAPAGGRPIRRLLVTLGGVDPDNVTGRLVQAFDLLQERPLEIRLLVGAGNPHADRLRALAAASPHRIEILQDVHDMPALYRWAEGVVSAGGSTCWEWLFYRLPASVVCLADNQSPVIDSLVNHRLALDLGWHAELEPDRAASKLRDWLGHADPPPALAPPLAVDGLGAERVAAVLDGTNAWLRRARPEDARLWFGWANDPAVRANGFHPEPISWETHSEWFERHRRSPDSRLWIGFDPEDRPLGYVRLHRRDADEWEVGVAVAAERRGQGAGQRLVRLALRRFSAEPPGAAGGTVILARIKPANAASLSLFQALGFQADAARSTADCCVLSCKLINCP